MHQDCHNTLKRKNLGYQDLNPDKLNQNQLCYHYTIPHLIPVLHFILYLSNINIKIQTAGWLANGFFPI